MFDGVSDSLTLTAQQLKIKGVALEELLFDGALSAQAIYAANDKTQAQAAFCRNEYNMIRSRLNMARINAWHMPPSDTLKE